MRLSTIEIKRRSFLILVSLLLFISSCKSRIILDNTTKIDSSKIRLKLLGFNCIDNKCVNSKLNLYYIKNNDKTIFYSDSIQLFELAKSDSIEFVKEILDNRYLLISECDYNDEINKHASSVFYLVRSKIWIYDLKENNLGYSTLNSIRISDIELVKNFERYPNKVIDSIDFNQKKLVLLKSSSEKINLKINYLETHSIDNEKKQED